LSLGLHRSAYPRAPECFLTWHSHLPLASRCAVKRQASSLPSSPHPHHGAYASSCQLLLRKDKHLAVIQYRQPLAVQPTRHARPFQWQHSWKWEQRKRWRNGHRPDTFHSELLHWLVEGAACCTQDDGQTRFCVEFR